MLLHNCILVGAGVVHGTSWELEKVRGNGVMAMLTLAIISVVAALQVFGKDRLVFWRESESGMSPAISMTVLGHRREAPQIRGHVRWAAYNHCTVP